MKIILLGTDPKLIEKSLARHPDAVVYSSVPPGWTVDNHKNLILDAHGECLILEEGEVIFDDLPEEQCRVYVVNGDVMTKENRYVTSRMSELDRMKLPVTDSYILRESPGGFADMLRERSGNRLAADSLYFNAFKNLKNGKLKEFVSVAEEFLFKASDSVAKTMCHYYCAQVYLAVNHVELAIGHAAKMLSEHVLMAEGWCLLGDAFLKLTQPARAAYFYDNAMFLGGKRRADDPYPVEIKKYKEYPERKMDECRGLILRTQDISPITAVTWSS